MGTIVLAGATVSGVLTAFMNRAEGLIDRARQAGIDVTQIAGNELRTTIQFAQVAYSNEMQHTIQRVGNATADAFRDIEAQLLLAERGLAVQTQNLAQAGQAIVNTLPLSNLHCPQLIRYSPCTVFRDTSNPDNPPDDIFFAFTGNFVDVSTQNFQSTLSFNGKQFNHTMNTTTDLFFQIPFIDVFPQNATNRIIYCEGTLTVPWIETGVVFNAQKNATFQVLIGAFPPSPGIIRFDYVKEKYHSQILSQGKTISSQRGGVVDDYGNTYTGGNDDKKEKTFLGKCTDGWKLVAGSSSITMNRNAGETTPPWKVGDDLINNWCVYKASTEHKIAGSSGIMLFDINFKQEKYTAKPKHKDITLKWGENYPIGDDKTTHPTPNGGLNNHWKVTFTPFNGPQVSFNSANNSNSYLKVERTPQGYNLKATLPDTIG